MKQRSGDADQLLLGEKVNRGPAREDLASHRASSGNVKPGAKRRAEPQRRGPISPLTAARVSPSRTTLAREEAALITRSSSFQCEFTKLRSERRRPVLPRTYGPLRSPRTPQAF